jgi:hypothetical protein
MEIVNEGVDNTIQKKYAIGNIQIVYIEEEFDK